MLKRFYDNYLAPIRSFSRPARLYIIMTVIDGIILSGWGLFFNFYMLQSGYSKDFLGLVNSAPSMATLLFGLPMGWLSDRIGRKISIIIGIAVASAAMLMQVTVHSQPLILAMAFLTGAANSLFIISQAPLMMKISTTENRVLLFSLNAGFQTIAGAVGSLFAGQLPGLFGGLLNVHADSAMAYRAVLIFSVLGGTLALIPLSMLQEPRSSVEKAVEKQKTKFGWTEVKLTARLSTPNVLIGIGAAALIPYANVLFRERYAVSDTLLGIMFSLSALITGVASIIGPRLSVRLGGKIRAVVFTQGASLVFLELLGFSPFVSVAVVSFLVRGALMNMAAPLYSAFVMEQVDENHQGMVNSVTNLAWNIGWAVMPYVSGVVQERYGFTPLFIFTGVLYALAISATWIFFHRVEQPAPPQS